MLNDLYVLVQIYQDLFSLCIIDIKYLFMLCLYVIFLFAKLMKLKIAIHLSLNTANKKPIF